MGRRKALKPQIDWLTGQNQTATTKENRLQATFPDWLDSLKAEKLADEDPIDQAEAQKELRQYIAAARASGQGQANIAIALTQILTECLAGECDMEGVPPIRDWNDVATILRAITAANLGMAEFWGTAIGIHKIKDLIEIDGKYEK